MSPNKHDLFIAWVCRTLQPYVAHIHGEISPSAVQAIPGDAGTRRYFRVAVEPSFIAVFAPYEPELNESFARIGRFMREQGLHVPKIIAEHPDGYFIVEDLGDTLLYGELKEETADLLYGEALISLLRLQQLPKDSAIFPDYDRATLRRESELFGQWFVEKLLGYPLSEAENRRLSDFYSRLEDEATSQPQVVVHRDYHCRNLLITADASTGIIDFQDALIGPFTYDLVSLLRDCYIAWPQAKVKQWALAYSQMAIDAGVLPAVEPDVLLRWFDYMGLQRHTKVLGIFARLCLRDGKETYLHDLPLVIAYFRYVLAQYSEFADLLTWFDDTMMPLIAKQRWMKTVLLS